MNTHSQVSDPINGFPVSVFLVMLLTLSSYEVCAQKTEGLYGNDLTVGSVVYVVTNRAESLDSGEPYFINEIDSQRPLAFIKATVLKRDSINIIGLNKEGLVSEMEKDSNDWLLFVHGDSKTFEQALMRGFDIGHLYDVNVLVFSWPSRDPEVNGIRNFKNSKNNVVRSMDHFRDLLTTINEIRQEAGFFSSGGASLSLFIHSLGNYYLENLVRENNYNYVGPEIFDNVILNAAAVNQDRHKKWVEKLGLQKRIYITCNRQDFNLKGVRIFTRDGKQLGEKVTPPLAGNANYVHFTDAVGFRFPTGTTHTYFIGEMADKSQNIRTFYNELLHGWGIDLQDGTRFKKREDGLGYDIIF